MLLSCRSYCVDRGVKSACSILEERLGVLIPLSSVHGRVERTSAIVQNLMVELTTNFLCWVDFPVPRHLEINRTYLGGIGWICPTQRRPRQVNPHPSTLRIRSRQPLHSHACEEPTCTTPPRAPGSGPRYTRFWVPFATSEPCLFSVAQSARPQATLSASSRSTYRMTSPCKGIAWSGGGRAACRRACAASRWAAVRTA